MEVPSRTVVTIPLHLAVAIAWLLGTGLFVASCAGTVTRPVPPEELNKRLLTAARDNRVDEVRRLIVEGAAPDLLPTSEDFQTAPLFVASQQGNVEMVQALLSAGANPNRREIGDISGETPLMVASRFGHEKVVERLLDGGANPNAWSGPFQTNGAAGRGYTALVMAVAYNHPETARRLLLAGASIGPDQTNLYNAITKGSVELVHLILAAGADPGERFAQNGRTPLEEAQRLTGTSREPIVTVLQRYLMQPRPALPPVGDVVRPDRSAGVRSKR